MDSPVVLVDDRREALVALAMRNLRQPHAGLAAMLAAASPALASAISAVFLIPSNHGPTELLAAGGPDAGVLGPPGRVSEQTDLMVQAFALETRPFQADGSMPSTYPWSSYSYLAGVSTLFASGAAAVFLSAAADPIDLDSLDRASAPAALLAHAIAAQREVEMLRRRVRDADQDREVMAARLEHDLRTPLTAIIGSARTLQLQGERLSDTDRAELLDSVICQSERLSRMVSEDLQVRRSRSDAPVMLRPTDLTAIARRTAQLMKTSRGGEIVLEVPEITIITDGDRFERALLNLLDNALRYSPQNVPVHLIGERTSRGATFVVADNGPGVSAEVLPGLFGAFMSDNRRDGGTGLGLHSARLLIEDIEGRVNYSRHGGWSRFSVTLPHLAPSGAEPPS